jgi:glyoxylase-like metal-dependent hydrolase (beta-lactamase superfamily II)
VVALAFLLFVVSVFAQLPTATISGVVKDSSGAVVPGATLMVRNSATGQAPVVAKPDVCCSWFTWVETPPKDLSAVPVTVSKVGGAVYMLGARGSGNVGASVGDDGVLLVDDMFAVMAPKIRAALKTITDKPLRFIITTHYHTDHAGGNIAYPEAVIIAQDNVRKRMQEGVIRSSGQAVKPYPPEALPVITFPDSLTVHFNGEDIRVIYFSGHTDGNSVVVFPKSNVVHMSDSFVTYGYPGIDFDAGGSFALWIKHLDALVKELRPDVKIIPGHGPICNLQQMKDYLAMLKEARSAVEQGMKQGKSLQQIQQEKVLAKWDLLTQRTDGYYRTADQFIAILYQDLTNDLKRKQGVERKVD